MKAHFLLVLLQLSILHQSQADLRLIVQDLIFRSIPLLDKVSSVLLPWERPITTTNPADIRQEYDFVIVGSGSAGSVLASRLSENPDWTVLLLELGKPESIYAKVPAAAPTLQATDYNYNLATEPEAAACEGMVGRKCAWPRGRALGGSSVINYMIYTRGNQHDYKRWVDQGNPGWSYDEVMPYYLKSEDVRLDEFDEGYHGKGGYLSIERPFNSAIARAFVDAGVALGSNEIDYNGQRHMGFSIMQATQRHGRRNSVATAFLEPAVSRNNLHVLTGAKALKVLIDDETKTATGIRYAHNHKTHEVTARKEVILSAGAFHSPQLLMLSGVGPQEHLNELNIPLIKNLPVGQTLYDHLSYVGLAFVMNQTVERITDLFRPSTILQGYFNGTGYLTNLGGIEAIGFIKTDVSTEVEDYPDMELIFSGIGSLSVDYGIFVKRTLRIRQDVYDKLFKPLENKPTWTVFPTLLHPKSAGYLRLKSTNPNDPPLFYANYFQNPEDIETMVEGVKYVLRMAETEPFQKFGSKLNKIPVPGCENFVFGSDDYWRCSVRQLSGSIHHQISTCKMGPKTDPSAVVDHELNVHGIKNLRVCDASVIPVTLSAHTNAPTIMIAEKTADIIKNRWN